MTGGGPNGAPNPMDLYLDGRMAGAERERFESRLAVDPALRAEAEAQGRIDGSLNRLFIPPAAPAIPVARHRVGFGGWRSPLGRFRWIAAAAVLLMGLAVWGVWALVHDRQLAQDHDGEYPHGRVQRSMAVVYQVETSRGFKPDWKCESDRQFATTFWRNLGQGLSVVTLPAGLESHGLSYTYTISPKTVYMIGSADGQHVLVFVDRKENDRPEYLSRFDGSAQRLRIFRREVGPLVLYEVTPLNRARLVDYMQLMDVPAEWQSDPLPASGGGQGGDWRKGK